MSASPDRTSEQLTRHGFLYTVGVAVQGVATLLVLPLVTRLLGPSEYGEVAVGLSIIQVGSVVAVVGLPAAITRAYFDPEQGLARARAMLGLAVAIGVVVSAGALLLRPVLGEVVSLSVAAVGAATLVIGGQAILRAQGRPVLFVVTAIGSTVGGHLAGLGAAAIRPSSAVYLSGYLLGAALTAVLTLLVAPPSVPWKVPGAVAEGLRIALPVLPHTAAVLVLSSGDPMVLARLLDPAEAGRYQVAMVLGLAPLGLLVGINNAWAPAVMGARADERWALLGRTTRPILALAAVSIVGLALIAPLAVRVLSPPEFGHDELVHLVRVISLCALGQVLYLAASSVIFTQKRTASLALTTPLSAAIFVVLSVPLVERWGLTGMAVAKIVGFAVLAVLTLLTAARMAPVPWQPTRWLPSIVGSVLAVVLLSFVPVSMESMWLQAGAAVVLGVVVLGRLTRTAVSPRPPAGS